MLRNSHPRLPTVAVKEELGEKWTLTIVRNVTNVKYLTIKVPLSLFFKDFESDTNNEVIFLFTSDFFFIHKGEVGRTEQLEIVQCKRSKSSNMVTPNLVVNTLLVWDKLMFIFFSNRFINPSGRWTVIIFIFVLIPSFRSRGLDPFSEPSVFLVVNPKDIPLWWSGKFNYELKD